MKKQRSTNLYYYIVLFIFSLTEVNAQIIYTDINPDDTVLCSGQPIPCFNSYNLDLNNDGTPDFVIYGTSYTYVATGNCAGQSRTRYIAKVTPLGSNEILTSSSNYTIGLMPNTIIDTNSVVWSNATNQILGQQNWACVYSTALHGYILSPAYSGDWINGTENFLGLKIISGLNSYFGWLRMSCYVSEEIAKDYAYNSIPNQPILAGSTSSTGINTLENENVISVFPNPSKNKLNIQINSGEVFQFALFNSIGERIIDKILTNKINEIDLSPYSNSIYFYKLLSDNQLIKSGQLIKQ